MIEPTLDDIQQHLDLVSKQHPTRCTVKHIGISKHKHPIYLVRLSDPDYTDTDKQHAFIVAGRHGNEESARAQALALIDWLVSSAGRSILKRQIISIIPCANPDGCVSDTYKNADDINPLNDIEEPTVAAEGKAFLRALRNNAPDLFIDLHAKGHSGHSFDMVLHPKQRAYTADFYFIWDIMKDMAQAGEQHCQIPHEIHSMEWPGWQDRGPCAIMYDQYKSIALLTESSESNETGLPLTIRARAGLERMKAALRWGQKRHPKLAFRGYPNVLVGASFNLGIVAIGENAQTRRKNRIKIWRQLDHFKKLSKQIPEQELLKCCELTYTGSKLINTCGIQFQVRGKHAIASICINGKQKNMRQVLVKKWSDSHCTYALIALPMLNKGKHQITVKFK